MKMAIKLMHPLNRTLPVKRALCFLQITNISSNVCLIQAKNWAKKLLFCYWESTRILVAGRVAYQIIALFEVVNQHAFPDESYIFILMSLQLCIRGGIIYTELDLSNIFCTFLTPNLAVFFGQKIIVVSQASTISKCFTSMCLLVEEKTSCESAAWTSPTWQ